MGIRPAEMANRAEARGRASIIAKLPSAPLEGSPEGSPVAHSPSPAVGFIVLASARFEALCAGSLLDALRTLPLLLAGTWECHRGAAQRWDAGVIRWPRHAWGVMHTAAAGTAYLLVAVAFSPAGFAVAVALSVACWLWL